LLLSRPLKPVILGLALIAGGCDRQSSTAAQPQAAPGVAATPAGSASAGSASATSSGDGLSGEIDRSHKGSLLPDFTFRNAAGKQLRLASLKGKPLLINLWATWCGPCVVEMPTLETLATDTRGAVKVLTISQDVEGVPVDKFMAERGFIHLEPWLDPKGDLDIHYGTGLFPTTVYYDADGREVWRYVGGRDWTTPDTAALLVEGTAL
jgi:thiol-disulfide isomerase/thioredoxin